LEVVIGVLDVFACFSVLMAMSILSIGFEALGGQLHELDNIHGAVQTGYRNLSSIVILRLGDGVVMRLEGCS
jgi:hypothetical protein